MHKHFIVFILSFLINQTTAFSLSCKNIFSNSDNSKNSIQIDNNFPADFVKPKDVQVLLDITLEGKPNIVNLKKVFPDLDQRVFIGVERWGHSFLQAGSVRLDGHVLKPVGIIENAETMRHGLIVEIKGLNSAQVLKIQESIRRRDQKMTVSCVYESLSLLVDLVGVDVSGRNKRFIWLSDLVSSVLNRTNSSLDLKVAVTKNMDIESFVSKLIQQEVSWRNQILEALSGESAIQNLINGSKEKKEIEPIIRILERRYSLKREQAEFLMEEFLLKLESGVHSLNQSDTFHTDFKTDGDFTVRFTYEQLQAESKKSKTDILKKFNLRKNENSLEPRVKNFIDDIRFRPLLRFEDIKNLRDEVSSFNENEVQKIRTQLLLEFQPSLLKNFLGKDITLVDAQSALFMWLRDFIETVKILETSSPKFREKRIINDLIKVGFLFNLKKNDLGKSVDLFVKEHPDFTDSSPSLKRADAFALWWIKKTSLSQFRIKEEHFESLNIGPVVVEKTVLPYVISQYKRYEGDQVHTLDVPEYVYRHIAPETFLWLTKSKNLPIRVYGSSRKECLKNLFQLGFSEIVELSRNKMTDFNQFIARRPETGETIYVLQTLLGRAALHEAIAHLIYFKTTHDASIDPKRIKVLKASASIEAKMISLLEAEEVKPDVLIIGNSMAAAKILSVAGFKEVKGLFNEELSGKFFVKGGKSVFVTSIEPRLFGDRASILVDSFKKMGSAPTVVFSGTAGSLNEKYRLNDFVMPQYFSLGNDLNHKKSELISNLAIKLLEAPSLPGLHKDRTVRHVSIDSILFEDRVWYDFYKKRYSIDVVEQELYDLALSVKKNKNRFYAILKISDELHSGLDFSKNEEYRLPIKKYEIDNVLSIILKEELGEAMSL